jgi:hypothetical protein
MGALERRERRRPVEPGDPAEAALAIGLFGVAD